MSTQPPDDYDYTPPWPPEMDEDEAYDESMMERGWQQGFRPPGPRPPFPNMPGIRPPIGQVPPPRPPGGMPPGWAPERWARHPWPFWGWWGYRLRNAWKDIKYLTDLIHDIVKAMFSNPVEAAELILGAILQLIKDGIIAPGPNSPVAGPGGGPGTGITGPIIGVTDGSDAAPGQVGEFLHGVTQIATSPGVTVLTTVSPLTVPAGDWDLWASMYLSDTSGIYDSQNHVARAGVSAFWLNPQPTGVSNQMQAMVGLGASLGNVMDKAITGMPARGSFTASTPLLFRVDIEDPDTAGFAVLTCEARRRR